MIKSIAKNLQRKIQSRQALFKRVKEKPRLGEILVRRGVISEQQLATALREQGRTREKLGKILFEHGWATAGQVSGALRSQHKLLSSATVMLLQASSLALPSHHAAAVEQTPQARAMALAASEQDDLGSGGFVFGNAFSSEIVRAQTAETSANASAMRTDTSISTAPHAEVAQLGLPDSVLHKAHAYQRYVKQASKRFDVPPGLIMSVIHAESHFNNRARSSMSAQGLMQIVAGTAGKEAYPMVFNKPGKPTIKQLRDPRTNILLGTAYLRKLERVYFKHIRNPDVRQAAVIAAYNVGPTKLRNIFGKYGMPSSVGELQQLLKRHTPPETQNYLIKVSKRRPLYRAIHAKGLALAPRAAAGNAKLG